MRGHESADHPLLDDDVDVSEAQEHASPLEREPTGQTGSAEEQYAGAGTTPDAEPELVEELESPGADDR